MRTIRKTQPMDESEFVGNLIGELPRRLTDSIMETKGCFRTEVRDTGHFICGIHTNGGSWKKAGTACPEAQDLSDLAGSELWMLALDIEDAIQSRSRDSY